MVEGLCGLTVPSSGFRVRVLRYRVRRHHWTFDSTAGPLWGSACALSLSPKKRGCIHRFHGAQPGCSNKVRRCHESPIYSSPRASTQCTQS